MRLVACRPLASRRCLPARRADRLPRRPDRHPRRAARPAPPLPGHQPRARLPLPSDHRVPWLHRHGVAGIFAVLAGEAGFTLTSAAERKAATVLGQVNSGCGSARLAVRLLPRATANQARRVAAADQPAAPAALGVIDPAGLPDHLALCRPGRPEGTANGQAGTYDGSDRSTVAHITLSSVPGCSDAHLRIPDRLRTAPAAAAKVAAAVLLFRTVTYLLPIPLEALAFLTWRHMHRRRHQSTFFPRADREPHLTDQAPHTESPDQQSAGGPGTFARSGPS
jgi:hypothetical protein